MHHESRTTAVSQPRPAHVVTVNKEPLPKATQTDLQAYAESYANYMILAEDVAAPMRQYPDRMAEAVERITNESMEANKALLPLALRTPADIQEQLKHHAAICTIVPKSYDDRARIVIAANSYVSIMLEFVVCHPSRPRQDRAVVLSMGTKLLNQHYRMEPVVSPRLIKYLPEHPETTPVTFANLEHWLEHPQEAVLKVFIVTKNPICQALAIVNYGLKLRGGAIFDVVYEASGLEIFTFPVADLLDMLVDACEVTNPILDDLI